VLQIEGQEGVAEVPAMRVVQQTDISVGVQTACDYSETRGWPVQCMGCKGVEAKPLHGCYTLPALLPALAGYFEAPRRS